jgi:hypothetical protein
MTQSSCLASTLRQTETSDAYSSGAAPHIDPISSDLRRVADERNMATPAHTMVMIRRWGRWKLRSEAMSGWVELGNGMAGFAVGLFFARDTCVMVATMVGGASR